MADPIIISQIIASEGLTGDKAKTRRAQLEKMPSDQLMSLLSNIQKAKISDVKGFSALNPNNAEGGRSEGLLFGNAAPTFDIGDLSSFTAPQPKKYNAGQEKELRFYAADYLVEACDAAVQSHNKYIKSIGVISSDALWHGMKNIANTFDVSSDGKGITTLDEQATILNAEYSSVQKIKNTKDKKGAFEFTFERERGVAFSPEKVENFKKSSDTYLQMSAYDEKYKNFKGSMEELRKLYAEDKALEAVRKAGRPVPNREKTFDTAVVDVINDFCSDDENLRNKFIEQLSGGATNKDELKANFMKNLEGIEKKFAAEHNQNLGGKSIEQYKSDYENKFKQAFGKENVKELSESYIERQKMGAMYTEIGVTIASSFLLPGSGLVAGAGSKLALKVGEKAAAQIIKGTMLTTTASIPAALTFTGAVTSEEGLTDEKKAEIGEKFKNGIMYGGFGAYASGPLGNVIGNIVRVKPNAFSSVLDKAFKTTNAVGKTAGVVAETSADVIFDRMTSDLSISESLEQNGLMNMGMMIAGGRLAKLQGIKVEKVSDNTFNVKDVDGKILMNGGSANEVGALVLVKAQDEVKAFAMAKEELSGAFAKEFKNDNVKSDVLDNILKNSSKQDMDKLLKIMNNDKLDIDFKSEAVNTFMVNSSRVDMFIKMSKNPNVDIETAKKISNLSVSKEHVEMSDDILRMYKRLESVKNPDGSRAFDDKTIRRGLSSSKLKKYIEPIDLLNDNILKFFGQSIESLQDVKIGDGSTIKALNSMKPEVFESLCPGILQFILDEVPKYINENLLKINELDPKVIKSFDDPADSLMEVLYEQTNLNVQYGGIKLLNNLSPKVLNTMSDKVRANILTSEAVNLKGVEERIAFISSREGVELVSDFENLLKKSSDTVDFKSYIITNGTNDLKGFADYVKNFDINKLKQMEPRIADFDAQNMVEFLSYHYKNKTEFTPDVLKYQGNLTHHLKNELVDAKKMNTMLSVMPSTDRKVGGFPGGWMSKVPVANQKASAEAVYKSINEFMTNIYADNSQVTLQNNLSKALNQPVIIQELGSGAVGTGYKLDIDGEQYVLKKFNDTKFAKETKFVHGRSIETQGALYTNARSSTFADFYFGKVAGYGDSDGFMVTKFLSDDAVKKPAVKKASVDLMYSMDVDPVYGHNFIAGKVIDYGGIYKAHPELADKGLAQATRIISDKVVQRKNGQYHMTDKSMQFLESYIDKNKNNPKFVQAIELIQKDYDTVLDADTKARLQDLKKSAYVKNLDPSIKRSDAHFAAYEINARISDNEAVVTNAMRGTGLADGAKFQHRAKGVTSLYNKLCKNLNKGLSLDAAINKIQDGLGTRTVLADYDYKQDPQIVAMLKTNPKKAYEMAAARQSEAMFKSVYNIIDQQSVSGRFEAMTIENYKGKDGIPYFSDEQVANLQDYAVKKGVTLDIEATSKVRDSGYSALQMNFKASDGTVLEWQMRGGKVDEFAECEHVIYDIKQKKDVTGGNNKLNDLYAPYEPAIRGLDDVSFKEYMEYLTDHYLYLRKSELGFDAAKPELPKKFNPILSADALVELHNKKMKVA